MSRVGLRPIEIPAGVTVTLGPTVKVKGPKGEMSRTIPTVCDVKQEGDTIYVTRSVEDRIHRSMHGLTRTLIANLITGVTEGFSKSLEINGVGYKAEVKGKDLVLTLGFSHPVIYPVPDGITIEASEPTKIKVSGIDKQKVGQVAAEIRGFRPPEPYKGKGVRYADEQVQRKAGKTAASAG